jgi:secondary thiamine-phosphate synthase enzyme
MQLTVNTRSRDALVDITSEVQQATASAGGLTKGLCMIYVPHTTAGVTINESADPSVRSDILKVLNDAVPWEGGYMHLEGNSAAHVKASLMGSSALVAIENGNLVLGTWQGIFFCEFDGPRTRRVNLTFISG